MDRNMNNLYVRTIGHTFNDMHVHVTPYEDVELTRHGDKVRIEKSRSTEYYDTCEPMPGSTNLRYIGVDIVQICLELDGELYVWKEVEI